jgi:hypothetical protein
MSFAPLGRLASGQSDFLPREITRKKPSKKYTFFAFFVILCGHTNFKTALAGGWSPPTVRHYPQDVRSVGQIMRRRLR